MINRHHFPMHKDGPYINETSKKAEIKDDFGHLRYVVSLSEFVDLDAYDEYSQYNYIHKDEDYQVEVVSFCYSEEPLILLNQTYHNFWAAEEAYKQNIRIYADLCRAETRHWQDISLYAKDINYHEAKCCFNCKYCQKAIHAFRKDEKPIFKCTNVKQYIADSNYSPMYDIEHCDVHDSHCIEKMSYQPIMPIIDPFNVCDGFKDKKEANDHRDFNRGFLDHGHYRKR